MPRFIVYVTEKRRGEVIVDALDGPRAVTLAKSIVKRGVVDPEYGEPVLCVKWAEEIETSPGSAPVRTESPDLSCVRTSSGTQPQQAA